MRALLIGTVALVACGTAAAADNGIYIGGSVGRASVKIDEGLAQFDDSDTGYKFILGIRPLDWLGFEANYVDFGNPEDNGLKVKAHGISAFAVPFYAFGPLDVYAKVGAIDWKSSLSAKGVSGNAFKNDGTDLAYGVGAQFRLLSLSVRAEYERFEAEDIDHLNMVSIGVTYTFL
jgi:Outer membrane protein beta-barrel domain